MNSGVETSAGQEAGGGPPQIVAIETEADIVKARAAGRDMASQAHLGLTDQTRLATSISELTRNVIRYAGTGVCTISDVSDATHRCISVVVEDHGPGIADLGMAMQDGFSTGQSLGAGLPGTKRLVSRFDIESQPGGTRVIIEIRRPRG